MEYTKLGHLPVRHCVVVLKDDPHHLERDVPQFFEANYPALTEEERLETLRLTYKLAGRRAERVEQDWLRHSQENIHGSMSTWEGRSHTYHGVMEEFFDLFTRLGLYLLRLERQGRLGSENTDKAAALA